MMMSGFDNAGMDVANAPDVAFWYGESGPAYIALSSAPLELDVASMILGTTTNDGTLTLNGVAIATRSELIRRNEATIPNLMEKKANAA